MFADEKSGHKVSKYVLAEWNIVFDKQETINNKSKAARGNLFWLLFSLAYVHH